MQDDLYILTSKQVGTNSGPISQAQHLTDLAFADDIVLLVPSRLRRDRRERRERRLNFAGHC